MTQSARIVIIGGGILGVSTLYHLVQAGWTDVVLLEKSDLTYGSTWHAAGLCTHFAHNATIMQIRAESIRLYKSVLTEQTGLATGFNRSGALRVTRLEDRMDEFRHVQGLGRFVGHDFEIIGADEVKALHPLTRTDDLIGAIYEPNDGYADPSQVTHAFAAAARAGGGRIFRQSRVVRIAKTTSDEWRVSTHDEDFLCEHVVNAAGTWCREVGEMMGVELPVVPVLHQYFVSESIDEIRDQGLALPILRDPEESWYTRPDRDGLIFGPYEKDAVAWSVDSIPRDFGAQLLPPDWDRVAEITDLAIGRIPALGKVGIRSSVNGPITFTPDANPLIGPVFGIRNAWLITGSSMGVMEGGGAGQFLAQWMVGGEPPMDALSVDSRRFGEFANRGYRVSRAIESFGHQFAIHYPREEREAGRPSVVSPFYGSLKAAGAVYGAVFGWERPNWFQTENSGEKTIDSFRRSNWFDAVAWECETMSKRVAICDLSALSKFEVSGVDAERFMETLGANTPPRTIGGVTLVHALTSSGGVHSEFVVHKRASDLYYLTSAALAQRRDLDLLRSRSAGLRVRVDSVTQQISVLSVAGPRAEALLGEVTGHDVAQTNFPRFTGRQVSIADAKVIALRVSYTGELGWELHIPSSTAQSVYKALTSTGGDFGLGYVGAFAMDSMRLEAGYRAWGSDLTTERTPMEAGMQQMVKIEDRDFVGKDAMLRREESTKRWTMHLLEIEKGAIDPFYSHPVIQASEVVGVVTSGAHGHRGGKNLAFAYLTQRADVLAGGLAVEVVGQCFSAHIVHEPPTQCWEK